MTAEQLKVSLLQMAIEGKLVPQLDDEPPVDVDAEEQEEVPFSIPDKWKWVRLGAILSDIEAGKSFKCIEILPVASQCGIVKVSAVTWGTFFQDESKTCYDNNCWKQEYAIHTHDFLISRANTADLVGSCVIVEHISKKLMLSDKILRLRFSSFIHTYFLLWVMRTKMIRCQLLQLATGTSNSMKNISQEAIKSLQIPLPPLAEQRRIVARLNELLPFVEEYGKSQSALHVLETELPGKLRTSLLQQAIMGKLVPQLDDEPAVDIDAEEPEEVPFAIPEKWKWISLGDAVAYGNAEQVAGSSISKEVWVLDLEDIQKNLGILLQKKRNVTSTSNKSRFFKENVLYSKLRPYLNKVIVADEDGYCTTEIIPIDPRSNGYEIDAEYLKTYLMSPYFVHYANEQSYGVKMPRLGTKDAKLAPFPFPPIAEQRRIVARLNELLPFLDIIN